MTTFYSIFVEQGSDVSEDNSAKMMMSSCSKFDVWQKTTEKFDVDVDNDADADVDEEDEFAEEFGPDGFPKGKRLAPVGANDEVSFVPVKIHQ
jgi:hypothetical protein